jgi:hypothetical protein
MSDEVWTGVKNGVLVFVHGGDIGTYFGGNCL